MMMMRVFLRERKTCDYLSDAVEVKLERNENICVQSTFSFKTKLERCFHISIYYFRAAATNWCNMIVTRRKLWVQIFPILFNIFASEHFEHLHTFLYRLGNFVYSLILSNFSIYFFILFPPIKFIIGCARIFWKGCECYLVYNFCEILVNKTFGHTDLQPYNLTTF